MLKPTLAGSFAACSIFSAALQAQHPLGDPVDAVEIRYARSQPVLHYILRIDSSDVSAFAVEIRIRNAPDTLRLAMFAHPEYDDQYFRYVEGLSVEGQGGPAAVTRLDSALWRSVVPGGEATVRYRIRLPVDPNPRRRAWKAYLTATGGLVGGQHAFMFLDGATLAPAHVTLEIPAGWDVATGLVPTSDPRGFFAPSAEILLDSPIFVGRFRSWRFTVDGVPHRVVYWPLPDAVPFDTMGFVGGLRKIAEQAVALFGRPPYREYQFLFQDGAEAGLEHLNSVTLGAPSAELARDLTGYLSETAHEFTHSWNLMRIRPAERGAVSWRPAGQSRGLWWSEGLTLFYADLFLRRAGLPNFNSTRISHLEGLLARYLSNPGNSRISAEQVSLVAYGATPGALGDYSASTHVQGEVLGSMLDLMVRDATGGRKSIDDVMREMLDRFSGTRGFTGADIQETVEGICGCPVKAVFDAYVRGAAEMDFNRYLGTIGLRAEVKWIPAEREGHLLPDMRLYSWMPPGEQAPSLLISNPASAWGRAGLHTGDRVVTVNGAPLSSSAELRTWLGRLVIGDTARIEVRRPAGIFRATVPITGYDRPLVSIGEVPAASERQRYLRRRWLEGAP